ncbi:MAG: pitrilysin family protein [Patescibacteria group bacterium]|nr:pitrilysin family protein [Patescibacteria group bacterium]
MIKKITLENGLRVILAPQKESFSTTVLVLVEAGSKYETKEISGLSHFLEHMCFKGTKKRPSQVQIANELDSLGAVYNAFTGHEYTGYYIKVRNTHLDKALDIISDIYTNQIFDENEIKKEKGVIIEEINMYQDIPNRDVWDVFLKLMYGNQPAGWNIAGDKETVIALKRNDFIKYHKQHYVAKGTVVVVSGNFNEEEAIGKIKNYFSEILKEEKFSKIKTIDSQEKPSLSLKHKETDQTHLIIGIRSLFNVFDGRKYILDVLAEVLGGGFSSRLWQRIREKMGVAYYIGAGTDLYTDHGYLAVNAGVDNKRAEEVITAVLEELALLKKEKISKEELDRAKEHLIGGIVLGLETSSQLASFYGDQEILIKEILTPKEIIKKIQEVTGEEITELAQKMFVDEKLNLALIGPFKDEEKFERILTFNK